VKKIIAAEDKSPPEGQRRETLDPLALAVNLPSVNGGASQKPHGP
jgi:hypothetical protein